MVKKIPDELRFGILRQEFGKYGPEGITLDNVPEGYIEKFTEDAIKRAKTLKDKHKDKYSDEYYLEMAKRLEMRDLVGRLLRIQEIGNTFSDVKDIQWAQYSYEEILQMEDNGVKIPDEVLAWAHSQQEADETNYVILTDNTEGEDASNQEGIGDSTDINELRKRSMKDIAKVEKAEKETEEYVIRYNEKSKAAKQIQTQKEDTYKDDLAEIKNLTSEWKELNDKQKNGTELSSDEQKRYKELGKLLNGTDGKFMKEIQADNHELDSFLDSLDELNNEIAENKQIAQETIQNAVQLGEAEAKVYIELPVTKTQVTDLSNSNETLNNIPENEISTVALDKGKDFEQYTNNISQDLNSESNVNLANFAADYSTLATQTENNTKAAMGDDFEKTDKSSENSEKQNKPEIDNMNFTFNNAFKSATITANATADLLQSKTNTETTSETLKKDNQKSLKDIIKLNIESKKSESQHNAYLSEEEAFLAQLETLQEQKASAASSQQITNTTETIQEPETNNNSEKQDLINKIYDTNDKDKGLKEGINKALLKGIVSNTKLEKTSKDLSKNITDLTRTNNNTMKVSEQTGIIGTGTFAKSYLTVAIGQALIGAGIPMLPNPATHAQGAGLIYAGDALTIQGGLENISGATAITTSAIGMSASIAADTFGKEAHDKVKETKVNSKANKNLLQETQKAIGQEENIEINDNSDNSNDNNNQVADNTDLTKDNLQQTLQVTENSENNNNSTEPEGENQQDTTVNSVENNENNSSENNNTNENNENTDSNNTTDSQTQPPNNTVMPIGFSAAASTIAAATTVDVTFALNSQKTTVGQIGENIEKEAKNVTKILKEAEKQTTQAEIKHNRLINEAESINQQVVKTQETVQDTDNKDEITVAQNLTETLGTEFKKVQSQDSQISQDANSTISGGILQLAKLQKDSNDFGKNITNFNSQISNQLDISNKTIVIGTGTGMLGAANISTGSSLIAAGIPLMANVITEPEGIALVAAGKDLTTIGILEAATGGIAAAAGTAGLVANSEARTNSSTNSVTEKFAQTNAKNTDKDLKSFVKTLNQLAPTNKEPKVEIENKNNEEEDTSIEGENYIDESILAASASSNASIVSTTETGDKTDKKLTRFNEESIIESRKKKKKVMAVSEAAKNSR